MTKLVYLHVHSSFVIAKKDNHKWPSFYFLHSILLSFKFCSHFSLDWKVGFLLLRDFQLLHFGRQQREKITELLLKVWTPAGSFNHLMLNLNALQVANFVLMLFIFVCETIDMVCKTWYICRTSTALKRLNDIVMKGRHNLEMHLLYV